MRTVTVLGWTIARGPDKRLVDMVHGYVICRVDVPTLTAWRSPRYVLWGARGSDVQIGSRADRARQDWLNRQARMARQMLQFQMQVRDSFSPALRRATKAMTEFAASMARIERAAASQALPRRQP